jgi:L-aminoadipate-semialdehyde dehydrogenase
MERIRKNCQDHLVWDETWVIEKRIIAVVGDLAEPHLGISDTEWQQLSESIDVIIHNGALVSS